MNTIRFGDKDYTKPELLDEIKTILLLPDLYSEVEKYIHATEQEKEEYLKRLKRIAYKQWHSDVRKTENPKAEFYTQCIPEALEIFKLICENPEYFIDPISKTINIPEQEPSEDITISEIQRKLRENFEKILKKCRQTTETVEISKGSLYSDIITEEQQLKLWEPSIYALCFYTTVGGICAGILEPTFLFYLVVILTLLISLICFIAIIPFSRYWCFAKIPYGDIILEKLLNTGCTAVDKFIIFSNERIQKMQASFLKAALGWTFLLIYWWIRFWVFVFGVVMFLFYELARLATENESFQSINREQTFYDGVADWYIHEIISKPETELTDQEKQLLYYFYAEYVR